MNRIKFVLSAIALIVFSYGMQFAKAQPAKADADSISGSRPNIVFVLTDDQGMGDLSCMGNEVVKTPHNDQLYRQSTRLSDYHVSPTCAPTRESPPPKRKCPHDARPNRSPDRPRTPATSGTVYDNALWCINTVKTEGKPVAFFIEIPEICD